MEIEIDIWYTYDVAKYIYYLDLKTFIHFAKVTVMEIQKRQK